MAEYAIIIVVAILVAVISTLITLLVVNSKLKNKMQFENVDNTIRSVLERGIEDLYERILSEEKDRRGMTFEEYISNRAESFLGNCYVREGGSNKPDGYIVIKNVKIPVDAKEYSDDAVPKAEFEKVNDYVREVGAPYGIIIVPERNFVKCYNSYKNPKGDVFVIGDYLAMQFFRNFKLFLQEGYEYDKLAILIGNLPNRMRRNIIEMYLQPTLSDAKRVVDKLDNSIRIIEEEARRIEEQSKK